MYPLNGIEDTSLFLFSDNIYTNPSSTNEDFSSSSLFNVFPSSHLINYNDGAVLFQDFHDILHQKNDDQVIDQEMVTHEGTSNINISKIADDMYSNRNSTVKKKKLSCRGSSKHHEQIRINRRCKKDRHSKIITANGSSRGRRMRLSLDVAKEFFGLQDMLGFDKASKTVEWLLMKSENAIKEVNTNRVLGMKHSPCPSTSVLSPIDDQLKLEGATKGKTKGGTQKVGASHPLTRESRVKARARARERTQEKKRLQLYNCSQGMNIGFDNPLLSCKKSAADGNKFFSINTNDPAPVLDVEDIFNSTEELIIDPSFFTTNNWNPYTIFNLHHNSGTTLQASTPFQHDEKQWERDYNI